MSLVVIVVSVDLPNRQGFTEHSMEQKKAQTLTLSADSHRDAAPLAPHPRQNVRGAARTPTNFTPRR